MRPSLWFVVPAHGRLELSALCLQHLATTCRRLAGVGIDATACVIACDGNLDLALGHGFATVEQSNEFLGRRFNDGCEFAAAEGVDYVIPCGSDDWVHPDLVAEWVESHQGMQAQRTMIVTRHAAAVAPGGAAIALLRIPYDGGIGIRLIPTAMLAFAGWRPAEDERDRGIDGSIYAGLGSPPLMYRDRGPLEIVDFKIGGPQLNPFETLTGYATSIEPAPWRLLAGRWPRAQVDAMRKLYASIEAVAA